LDRVAQKVLASWSVWVIFDRPSRFCLPVDVRLAPKATLDVYVTSRSAFSPHLYRARNLVERFFNKIKQCRRVATRYNKLAANYLTFIQLASIRLLLRVNESTP